MLSGEHSAVELDHPAGLDVTVCGVSLIHVGPCQVCPGRSNITAIDIKSNCIDWILGKGPANYPDRAVHLLLVNRIDDTEGQRSGKPCSAVLAAREHTRQ